MSQLFQLRKELSVPATAFEESATTTGDITTVSGTVQATFSNGQVITENGKYKVSRLAPNLGFLPDDTDLSCSVDARSGYALCCDTNNIYVWPFASAETQPNFVRIPLHDKEYESWSHPPLCCFTWPSVVDRDFKTSPGLCLVNSRSGEVQFYEDADTVSRVASFLTQTKHHKTTLKMRDGEFVETLMNAEPAGVMLSTNFGRVELVSIRDASGKPFVSLRQTIIKCQVGMFSSMSKSKKVVSLKLREITGKGERLVSILTAGGNYQLWNLSSVGHCYKKIDVNVFSEISQAVSEHFPLATSKLQLLDCHPLSNDSNSYVFLSCLEEGEETHYLLSTVLFDEDTNSFAIFSSYRLNTYKQRLNEDFTPRLIVPAAFCSEQLPVTSIYTLTSDAVIITQTSSKLDSKYHFKRRWEDIIRFNKDMHILGYDNDSDALYLTDGKTCTLKLETFEKYESSEFQETRFIKSHIDQYVYFSGSSAESLLNFNLPDNLHLTPEEIASDIQIASEEIRYASSSHIPPIANNVVKHLKLRSEFFDRLLVFVAHNFLQKTSSALKFNLIHDFETIKCIEKIYTLLPQQPDLVSKAWKSALTQHSFQSDSQFVTDGLSDIPIIVRNFLKNLVEVMKGTKDVSTRVQIAGMVNDIIYQSVLEQCENKYRFGLFQMEPNEPISELPWFIDGILESLNEIFYLLRDATDDLSLASEFSGDLFLLVKSLYYMVKQASACSQGNAGKYSFLFNDNHLIWNRVLREVNRAEDSILITDFYQDLEALVETLQSLPNSTALTLSYEYFDKYGYDFAIPLFIHYLDNGRWDDMYQFFSEGYLVYLERFFSEYPEYKKAEWIGEIFSNKYREATMTLLDISTGTDSLGLDVKKRQARLSIAKLSALTAEVIDPSTLKEIQTELDLIDGQILLSQELELSTLNPMFEEFITYKTLFKHLGDAVRRKESLSVPHIIELFTLLNNDDCYGFALSTLAIDHNLPTDMKQYCASQIWRRCIISGENAVRKTLRIFFEQELYNESIELPVIDTLSDENRISESYLDGLYHGLTNITDSAADIKHEISLLSKSENAAALQSIIGEINRETGNKCAIDYNRNSVLQSPNSL